MDTRHEAAVTCLGALADGHWASGDAAGVLIIRKAGSVSCALRFAGVPLAVCTVSNGMLAVGTQHGVAIHEHPGRAGPGRAPAPVRFYEHPRSAAVLCILGLPGGAVVTAGTGGSVVRLPHISATPITLVGHSSRIRCLLALADGVVASASRDTTVRCWRGHRCQYTLRGHTAEVTALAEIPGAVLASGSADADVRLWRLGTCIRVLRGHTAPVSAVLPLPGGLLASAGAVLRVWA